MWGTVLGILLGAGPVDAMFPLAPMSRLSHMRVEAKQNRWEQAGRIAYRRFQTNHALPISSVQKITQGERVDLFDRSWTPHVWFFNQEGAPSHLESLKREIKRGLDSGKTLVCEPEFVLPLSFFKWAKRVPSIDKWETLTYIRIHPEAGFIGSSSRVPFKWDAPAFFMYRLYMVDPAGQSSYSMLADISLSYHETFVFPPGDGYLYPLQPEEHMELMSGPGSVRYIEWGKDRQESGDKKKWIQARSYLDRLMDLTIQEENL